MGRIECGEKNTCCCGCCDLENGIKILGAYLVFELGITFWASFLEPE